MSDNRAAKSQGQAAVEFALVLPVLFMIIFGIIDMGRGFSAYLSLSNGAREGARVAVIGGTDAQVRAAVRAQAGLASPLPDGQITIVPAQGSRTSGNPVTVTVVYGLTAVTPMVATVWGGGPLTLAAGARMRVE